VLPSVPLVEKGRRQEAEEKSFLIGGERSSSRIAFFFFPMNVIHAG
jgi:hypothetical protein